MSGWVDICIHIEKCIQKRWKNNMINNKRELAGGVRWSVKERMRKVGV